MSKLPAETPFTNTADHNVHIGGIVIKPGHSRMVPTTQHPDYHTIVKTAQSAPTPADVKRAADLKKLLDTRTPGAAVKAIGEATDFSDGDLEQLAQLESTGANRKQVLQHLEVLKLNRAKDQDHDGEGILAMLSGENVAAGIEASDILSIADLDALEKAEQSGDKRQDVLLAIQGKRTALSTAAYKELLSQPDAAKAITEATDLSTEDLKALEDLEFGAEEPRDEVVKAIEAKRATVKSGGGLLARAKRALAGKS